MGYLFSDYTLRQTKNLEPRQVHKSARGSSAHSKKSGAFFAKKMRGKTKLSGALHEPAGSKNAAIGAAIAALAIMASPTAAATDLVNKDSVTYAIAVSSGVSTMKTQIAGKTVKIGVCASTAAKCIVSVEGVGEIEVTGADDVIIENGRLSKK